MDELKTLNTKLVLRNDTTAKWNAVAETAVLLKGEVGLEFLESGEVKLKIGDGTTPWGSLEYWGGDLKLKEGVMVLDGEEISLHGFAAAETGAQLVKGSDGNLSWVVPSTETVEGLQTTVESLKTDVTNMQAAVDAKAEASEVEELAQTVAGKADSSAVTALGEEIAKKANAEDVYSKTDVDSKLSSVYRYKGSVENYSDLPSEGLTIGDVYNIANASILNNIEAGDNVAWTGASWDVLAGTVDLSGYATSQYVNEELAKKVAIEEGKSLVSDELISKLEGMAADGEKNYVRSVDEANFAVDSEGHLTLLDLEMNKVSGLTDELAKKVNAVEGKELISSELISKLEGMAADGEANVLESVKINGVALEVAEKAVNIPVGGENLGVVKGASGENMVSIAADGTMEVESINVATLVQTTGEFIVLNGGTATGY